tara:strand:+ start:42 stop:833 length:792 start_codon:yes stop_codon:yes gene_type:complete
MTDVLERKIGNVKVKHTKKNHAYYITEGEKKYRPSSVSTIIKVDDSFGAGARAGRANYLETLVEQLSNDDLFKELPQLELQERLIEIRKLAEKKWTDAAKVGSIIHNWIEGYLRGDMAQQGYHVGHSDWDNNIRLMQYKLYEYLNTNIKKVYAVEHLIFDNTIIPFAGQFDCWIEHKQHGECLVDWKTMTKKSVTKSWKIQLCGYMYALCNELGREPYNRLIVAIDKDTKEIHEFLYDVETYNRDLQIFKNLLQVHQFYKENN